MTTVRLGMAVRLLREEHNFTQEDLARRLGTSKSAVSKIECGTLDTRLITFEKIGRAFGMEAWEVLRFASRLQETIETRHEDEPGLRYANWRTAA